MVIEFTSPLSPYCYRRREGNLAWSESGITTTYLSPSLLLPTSHTHFNTVCIFQVIRFLPHTPTHTSCSATILGDDSSNFSVPGTLLPHAWKLNQLGPVIPNTYQLARDRICNLPPQTFKWGNPPIWDPVPTFFMNEMGYLLPPFDHTHSMSSIHPAFLIG